MATARAILLFKVTSNAKVPGERLRPHRTIAVPIGADLYDLAVSINRAFGFDMDHAFGFYDNLKNPYAAGVKYELFSDLEGEEAESEDPAERALAEAMEQVDVNAVEQDVKQYMQRRMEEAVLPHVPEALRARVSELLAEQVFEQGEGDLLPALPFGDSGGDPFGGELGAQLAELLGGSLSAPTEEHGVKGVPVSDVFQQEKQKMLYLFDYGDDWTFEVQFLRREAAEKGARYPRVLESKGAAPEQYPDYDEEQEED